MAVRLFTKRGRYVYKQIAGHDDIKTGNKSLEIVANFKYFRTKSAIKTAFLKKSRANRSWECQIPLVP